MLLRFILYYGFVQPSQIAHLDIFFKEGLIFLSQPQTGPFLAAFKPVPRFADILFHIVFVFPARQSGGNRGKKNCQGGAVARR